jgi:hypothetical protein
MGALAPTAALAVSFVPVSGLAQGSLSVAGPAPEPVRGP